MRTLTLDVDGMSCDGCEANVRSALAALEGVEEVTADHRSSTVVITFDEARNNPATFRESVESAGYAVVG